MSHRGRLLVATPLIEDPNFLRTVVLLLQHDEDGAFGVVLNRPTTESVIEVLPRWAEHASAPGVVFVGGPVAADAMLGIAAIDLTMTGFHGFDDLIGMGWMTLDLAEEPDDPDAWRGVRLFVGGAGWAPGQLEDEIAEGAWWVLDADPGDVTTVDPGSLWSRVLRRQRGGMRWFANCPLDPTAN